MLSGCAPRTHRPRAARLMHVADNSLHAEQSLLRDKPLLPQTPVAPCSRISSPPAPPPPLPVQEKKAWERNRMKRAEPQQGGVGTRAQLLGWALDHLGRLFAPTWEGTALHVLLPLGDGGSFILPAGTVSHSRPRTDLGVRQIVLTSNPGPGAHYLCTCEVTKSLRTSVSSSVKWE